MLVLDSGAVTALAKRNRQNAATIEVLRREGLWPPIVPSIVLVETITGRPGADANTNRLLKTCDVTAELSDETARRAAQLRFRARRGGAVDAVVVASAEPAGSVLTGDLGDLRSLASHADHVTIASI